MYCYTPTSKHTIYECFEGMKIKKKKNTVCTLCCSCYFGYFLNPWLATPCFNPGFTTKYFAWLLGTYHLTKIPAFVHRKKNILITDDLNLSSELTHARTRTKWWAFKALPAATQCTKIKLMTGGRKWIWKLGLWKTLCGHRKLLKFIGCSIENHNYGST